MAIYYAGGNWDWFPVYGPVNFTLPDPCVGMLVMLHGHLHFRETAASHGSLGLQFSGAGIVNVPDIEVTKLFVGAKMMDTSRGYLFRGQRPQRRWGGVLSGHGPRGNATSGASYIGNSWVSFLMFTGA